MKKIMMVVMLLIASALLLTSNLYAASNDWTKSTDGYFYYNIPTFELQERYILEVGANEIIEIKDFDKGIYVPDEKTKKVIMEVRLEGTYVEVYFQLYDVDGKSIKSYPTTSYVSLKALNDSVKGQHSAIGFRKLVDPNDIPESSFKTYDKLPKTTSTGNYLMDLGRTMFNVKDGYVIVTITYYGTHNLKYKMDAKTDLSIFKNFEAYYINKTGSDPQIFINQSDRAYLRSIMTQTEAPAFVPHVIWELKNNALTKVDSYKAYAHLKQNDKGVMMAYYYTDAIVMGKILSTTLTYTTRYYEKKWFGLEQHASPWETKKFEYTSDDTLSYKDKTSQWYDYITGFGLISIGIRSNTTYQVPRINEVKLDNVQKDYNITRNEIEKYFSSISKEYIQIKDKAGYKLWAFALQEGKEYDMGWFGTMKHEFYNNPNDKDDPKNFQVMEIVYETQGQIYTTIGNDLELEVTVDPKDDGIEREKNESTNWPILISGGVFIVCIVIGVFNGSVVTKKGINFKFIGGVLILTVAAFLISFFWPQIIEIISRL